MIYGSVCSGIGAPERAWRGRWRCAFMSEIEAFPRAVLRHHYPEVPLHGDFTTIQAGDYDPIDLLVGGTPCQAFSVAGLRGGIHDERGNLALEFLKLAQRLRPRWLVFENVPGLLSSTSHDAPDPRPPDIDLDGSEGPEDGAEVVVEDSYDTEENHAFGCFLAGLSELGYGWAYRVLDAQYAGLAQRRARVFLVGYLGDWRPPAAVLFERHSLSGHPPPSRETREDPARPVAGGSRSSGGYRNDADTAENLIAGTVGGAGGKSAGTATGQDAAAGLLVAATLEATTGRSCGAGTPTGMLAFGGNNTTGAIDVATAVNAHGGPHGRQDFESETFIATTLRARNMARGVDSDATDTLIPVAFKPSHYTRDKDGAPSDLYPPLSADADKGDQDPVVLAFTAKDYGQDASEDLAPTLRSGDFDGSHANGGVMPAVAYGFEPRSRGDDGRGYGRAPHMSEEQAATVNSTKPGAVAYGISRDVLERSGEGAGGTPAERSGLGVNEELSPTVKAGRPNAVAFALRGREGGVAPELRGDAVSALRAASGGSSRDYIAFDTTQLTNPNNRSNPKPGDATHGLSANQHPPAIIDVTPDVADPISASEADTYAHAGNNPRLHNVVAAVRRLTPRECERLQGFPDDFTLVPYRGKPAADGPRYKGLGNSMAVPCMAWLGERIDAVEAILAEQR